MFRRFTLPALAILGLYAVSLIGWWRIESRPPAWDESVHLNLALDYRDRITQGTPVTSSWASIYPPLYHLSLIPALTLHSSESSVAATHLLYALFLLWAMAALAKDFGGTVEDGLWAGALVLGSWLVLFLARRPLIDFSLMAWVTVGMALVRRTDDFADRRAAVLWALWSGLGLLLKPFYPIYFVLPCLYLLWKSRRQLEGHPWWNFLIAVAIIVVVSSPWYLWRWPVFFGNLGSMLGERGAEEGDPSFTTWAGWWFYLRALLDQFGPWTLAVVMAGIAWLIARREKLKDAGFLIAWILSAYLFFTIQRNKDLRYTVGILPALALLATLGWRPSQSSRGRRLALWGAAAVLLLLNVAFYDHPRHENWQHQAIGDFLWEHWDRQQPFLVVSVISNNANLFGRNLHWSMRARGQAMSTSPTGNPNADFTEFIVVKTGDLGVDSQDLQKEWDRQRTSGRAFSEVYPKVATFPLPDGSEAQIYQRNPDPLFRVGTVSRATLERRIAQALRSYIQGPLKVSIGGTPKEWRYGRIASAEISGGPWKIKDIPVAQAKVHIENVWLNLYRVWEQGRPGVMSMQSLAPTVEIKASDVEAVLLAKVKGLREAHVHFVDNQIHVQGRFRGWPVAAAARIEFEPHRLVARIRYISIRGVPLPGWLFGAVHVQALPLDPIPSFPTVIHIQQVTLDHDVLEIRS